MDFELFEPALVAAAAAAASAFVSLLRQYRARRKSGSETVEDRIAKLTRSLQQTSHLIAGIEEEIATRTALATKLKDDVERYNQLKALNQQQVEAIAQTLRGELSTQSRRSFWSGFWMNFGFFACGALLTYFIK